MSSLDRNKVVSATKWSAITEIAAKLVTPITSMVLAHLLTPDAFGIVATIAMIVSFAEIFTDAGFQKYIVQHEFIDDNDKDQSINVAFWSNLVMSFLLWFIIYVFDDSLAVLVGNPGLGHVITISSISIPLAAFSSIQMAVFRRDLNFKALFKVRIIGVCVPLVVTIPLALVMRNFWALVIGTISQNLVNSVVLMAYSSWKPRLFYSWAKFKEMFSFTVWSMIEAVSIWLTSYVDVLIVGVALSQYYLGLYKTSMSIVGQVTSLVGAITTPVLFASLSRLQDSRQEFESLFFRFQKIVALLIFPLGVGLFFYRDIFTELILGSQWREAAAFIGLWSLTSAISIVFAHYCSEVYRSLGKPRLSVLAQWLHIIVLWPVVLISVKHGFDTLCIARALVRLELVLVQLVLMWLFVHISPIKMLKNCSHIAFATAIMSVMAIVLSYINTSIIWQIVSICICAIVYGATILLFGEERKIIFSLFSNIRNSK